jgi:glycine/D-amino acid oxidase-like deaminating enzyme
VVALTADDQARLSHQLVFQQKLGLPLQWISAAETRRREPHLAGKLAGAVFSPEDTQVDNRKLAAACALPPRRLAPSSGSINRSRRSHRPQGVSTASSSPTEPRSRLTWSCLQPEHGPVPSRACN